MADDLAHRDEGHHVDILSASEAALIRYETRKKQTVERILSSRSSIAVSRRLLIPSQSSDGEIPGNRFNAAR